MSEPLRFIIPGPPVPCGRARSGKGRTYTPPKTRAYESLVRTLASIAALDAKWSPPEGATFAVTLDVYRARRAGDVDNYLKAVLDGMNRVVFPDDRYVVAATVRLHVDRRAPRAEVTVGLAVEVAA